MEQETLTLCEFDPAAPGPYEQYFLPYVAAAARREPERFAFIGAARGRFAVGAAAITPDGDEPYAAAVASLFVDPLSRRQGVGTALLAACAQAAEARGAEALTLSYILGGDELAAMDAAVRKLGGEPEFYLPVYTMNTAEFHASRLLGRAFRPDYKMPEEVMPFTRLTPEQLEALYDDPEVPWYVHPRNRVRMQPGLSLAYVQDGRVTGFWLGCMSTPGNYAVQGVWRSESAPLATFHVLVAAHLSLCYYHGGGDFLYHCSPAVEFADELIQRYSEGNYRRLEEHHAAFALDPKDDEDDEDDEDILPDEQSGGPEPADSPLNTAFIASRKKRKKK